MSLHVVLKQSLKLSVFSDKLLSNSEHALTCVIYMGIIGLNHTCVYFLRLLTEREAVETFVLIICDSLCERC